MYQQPLTPEYQQWIKEYQEKQEKENKQPDAKFQQKCEQYAQKCSYQNATDQEKMTESFFPVFAIEQHIDAYAIKFAQQQQLSEYFQQGKMSSQVKQKLDYMKCKHRTSLLLQDWFRDDYWTKQEQTLHANIVDNIDRVDVNHITAEEFLLKYEIGSKPCIITGITDTWPGKKEWQVRRLIERFGDSMFKIGESDGGRKLKVTMKEYIEYALYNRDDSPLYLFEANLEEHPEFKAVLDDYKPPEILKMDLFTELLGEKKAPPHRWFLVGPKRSGSEVHIDPLGTSAWNASVTGRKRWIMFPPAKGLTKNFVRGEHLRQKDEDNEAIQYFDKILPRLLEKEGPKGSNKLPTVVECIQYPGEVIFVPGLWWHGVLNLDLTIAVTQNFCNKGNFDQVWKWTRKGRKRLSVNFLRQLKQSYPDLYRRAVDMNSRDNFVMWDHREKYKSKFTESHNDSSSITSSSSDSSSEDPSSDSSSCSNSGASRSSSRSIKNQNNRRSRSR